MDFLCIVTWILVHFWEEQLPLPILTVCVSNHQHYTKYEYGNKYTKYKEDIATRK